MINFIRRVLVVFNNCLSRIRAVACTVNSCTPVTDNYTGSTSTKNNNTQTYKPTGAAGNAAPALFLQPAMRRLLITPLSLIPLAAAQPAVALNLTVKKMIMKTLFSKYCLTVIAIIMANLLFVGGMQAQVTVTGATNGTNINSQFAANGSTPTWTTLGTITLQETTQAGFIMTSNTLHTLILTAPAGWAFNPGIGSAAHSPGSGDIVDINPPPVVGINVTANTITVTVLSKNGNTDASIDNITITSIQVQATTTTSVAGNIYRSTSTPGTLGIPSVTTTNTTSGSGGTNFGNLSLAPGNPVPTLASISPNNKCAGDAAFTLTVNGSNFISGSIVQFNGVNRTTTFVSSTQLTAAIAGTNIATAGTFPITVFNPTPGGGTSGGVTFTVNTLPTVATTLPGGTLNICVNGTQQLTNATAGGVWGTTTPLLASVNASGLVTGLSAGAASITYTVTNGSGCSTTANRTVNIFALPTVSITGSTSICVGATTTLSPTTGGTWASNNAAASVTNAGVVTGVSAGSATFTFTSSTAPFCTATTGAVTVNAVPQAAFASTTTLTIPCGSAPPAGTSLSYTNNDVNCPISGSATGVITGSHTACGGTYTENWSFTDAFGRTITASRVITVEAAAVPTMTALGNITISCLSELPSSSTIVYSNGLSGGCLITGASNTSTFSSSPACNGTITETWTATDVCGRNLASVSRTITLTRTGAPTISNCPSSFTVYTGIGNTACSQTATWTPPTATTSCGEVAGVSTTHAPGATFPVGTTTVTYTFSDCAGFTNTCSFDVTVVDNTAPVIICPAAQSFCIVTSNTYTIPVLIASDNCGIASIAYDVTGVTARNGSGTDASGTFALGTSTITWTVTDIHSNVSTCSTTVNVYLQPVSGTLAKTPNVSKVCQGTDVSALLTAGSGGAGTITDVLEFRCKNIVGGTWTSWMSYTSGANINTTGKLEVEVRTYRTATGTNCNSTIGTATVVNWMVNVGPTSSNNRGTQTLPYGTAIATVVVTANDIDSDGSDLNIDGVSYVKGTGSPVNGFPLGLGIFPNTVGANTRTWNVTGCIKGEGVGTYVVTVKVKDECGVVSSTSFTVIVTPGNVLPVAETFYTGASFYWTTSSSSSTATLTLAATIRNQVANCGDITTARISFFVRNGSTLTPIGGAQNLPVGLVNPADPSVGAASAIVQYNIGNNTVLPLDIAVRVTGNFYNNTSTLFDKQITIAVPTPGGRIVGGGTVDNLTSGGYLGGSSSKLTDFTFEVKYNKSLSNPQGRVELFIRSWKDKDGNLDNVEHTYKVKSTAISVLAVGQPTPAYAQFGSKSNLSEVLPDGSSIGLESGITLTMDLFDAAGLTTKKDSIGITLYRKNGGIWYSNNWSTTQARTLLKAINDGEEVVSGSNGSFAPNNIITQNEEPPVKSVEITKPAEINWKPEPKPFSVMAYPNPSASDFNIVLEGGNNEKVQIVVYDISGKPVKTIEHAFVKQQIIRLGADLRPGTYLAEIRQGNNVRTLKLIRN